MTPKNVPLWTFYYKQGPAPKFGTVEAKDEGTALMVAARWCLMNGYRPPASVQPEILATEEILSQPLPGATDPMQDAVAATTAMNSK